tara:strand:+ start:1444 stop:1797 length:354 start_codon:yes stop_codon:yes gene_type:complete
LIFWSLLLLVSLSSCSWKPEKEIVVQTKIVTPTIEIKQRPKGVKMLPVKFYVVTEKNYEEFKEKFKKDNGDFVFYAMSVPSYENLALDMAELRRYIEQQKEIIIYYEKAVKPKEEKK